MDSWLEIRKGLFVVDADIESAGFLGRMVEMTKRNDASLTIVHCLDEPPRWSSTQLKEAHALLQREWQGQLDRLVEAHGDEGVTIDSLLLVGDPVKEVTSLVERGGYDFVAKVASDQEEQGRLSSMEIDLIRHCPCTVWIDRAPAGDRYQTVLVAVDCINPDHEKLNHELISGTLRFCQGEDFTIHVLHVWHFPGETMLRGRSLAAADKVDAMVEDERRIHEQAFDALLAPYASQGLRLNKHLVKGQLITVIKELTARSRIDIVVMGAGAKTGIAGWLLGSSAEQMLKVVPCSVVAKKQAIR